jgi:hypothetical protein
MGTEGEIKPTNIRREDTRHEWRQVNAFGLVLFGVLFIVFAFVTHFAVLGIFNAMEKHAAAIDKEQSPILTAEPNRLPALPRLQPDPVGDLHQMRTAEDRILRGYAWIDQKNGIVRIPISRAMQLLVQRGIPTRAGTTPPGEIPPSPMAPSPSGVESPVEGTQQRAMYAMPQAPIAAASAQSNASQPNSAAQPVAAQPQ